MAAAVNRNPELFGAVCLHDVWLNFSNLPACATTGLVAGAEDFFSEVKQVTCFRTTILVAS